MKAAVLDEFGPSSVIQIRDIPKPTVSDGKVLVEVHATSINPIDWKMRDGQMAARFGEDFPMVLGFDCSGVVADVAADVSGFEVGDVVFGRSDLGTGGCYAEYAEVSAGTLVKKPDQLSHEEAASIVLVGLTVINGLIRCVKVQPGQKVLIVGASGGVGTLAVQIAKNVGAHVTGVCSGKNADLVASLGADAVIAYDRADFADEVAEVDVVLDLVGGDVHERSCRVLRPGGILVYLIAEPFEDRSAAYGVELRQADIHDDKAALEKVVALAADGTIRPQVSRVLPLSEAAEAHRLIESGRNTRGRIVLSIA